MVNKKYILTDDTVTIAVDGPNAPTLYRIKAITSFGDVLEGDLGGYIESERNLSQNGNCWVYDGAMVLNEALVSGDAIVSDAAVVRGGAVIRERAVVTDEVLVDDYVVIGGTVCLSGNAIVAGDGVVRQLVKE